MLIANVYMPVNYDFDVMKTQPYIFVLWTFAMRDYKKMVYDNRVQII